MKAEEKQFNPRPMNKENTTAKELEGFHKEIDRLTKQLHDKHELDFNVGVMQDLKRMAELGCFTVHTTQMCNFPQIDMSDDGRTVKARMQVPRMHWAGEQKIINLRTEIDLFKSF